MKRRIVAVLLALALIAAGVAVAEGFDYSGFAEVRDLERFSYQERDDDWVAGFVTGGDPFVMLLVLGNYDGEDLYIGPAMVFDDGDRQADRLDFVIDGTVHSLRLTDEAKSRDLEGFWLYSSNLPLLEALAEGAEITMVGYLDGEPHTIELSADECETMRFIATELLEGGAMEHLSVDLFQGDNAALMDMFLSYESFPAEE